MAVVCIMTIIFATTKWLWKCFKTTKPKDKVADNNSQKDKEEEGEGKEENKEDEDDTKSGTGIENQNIRADSDENLAQRIQEDNEADMRRKRVVASIRGLQPRPLERSVYTSDLSCELSTYLQNLRKRTEKEEEEEDSEDKRDADDNTYVEMQMKPLKK